MSENERTDSLDESRWYGGLAGGLLPLLVVGSVASALANAVAFAGWAVLTAFLHAFALRRVFGSAEETASGPSPWILPGTWAVVALSWLALAFLFAEPLARGAAAFLPAGVRFVYSGPWPVFVVLSLLGAGLTLWLRAVGRR